LKKFITLSTLALSLFALTAHADSRDEALQKAKTDLNSQSQVVNKARDDMKRKQSDVNRADDIFSHIADSYDTYKKLPDSQNEDLNQDIQKQTDRLHNLGQKAFLNLQEKNKDYFKSKEVFDKENQKLNVIKRHLFNIEHNRY
jgi:hypothetical protein